MPPKIVALGSSFASGPGLKPYKDTQAARSGRNYASLLARRLRANLIDLSSGGSTLLNIIDSPQGKFPPQIEGIPADANIITITSGGNDMAYIGRIMVNSAAASWLTWPLARLYEGHIGNKTIDEAALVSRFRQVIAQIRNRAPKAEIILVEYLTLIGHDYRPFVDGPLNDKQSRAAQQRAAMLRREFTPKQHKVKIDAQSCRSPNIVWDMDSEAKSRGSRVMDGDFCLEVPCHGIPMLWVWKK